MVLLQSEVSGTVTKKNHQYSIFEDRVVRDVVPVLEEFGVFDEVVALLKLRVRDVKRQTDGT